MRNKKKIAVIAAAACLVLAVLASFMGMLKVNEKF
jgi:hypothetical protein